MMKFTIQDLKFFFSKQCELGDSFEYKESLIRLLEYVLHFYGSYKGIRDELELQTKYYMISKTIFFYRRVFRLFSILTFIQQLRFSIFRLKTCKIKNIFKYSCYLLGSLFNVLFQFYDSLALINHLNSNIYKMTKLQLKSLQFRALSLIFDQIFQVIQLFQSFSHEHTMMSKFDENMTLQKFMDELRQYKIQRINLSLNTIRNIGDITIAFDKLNVFQNFINIQMNRRLVGLGGIISTLISIYQSSK